MIWFTKINSFLCERRRLVFLITVITVLTSCVGKVKNTKQKTATSVQEAEKILELTLAKEFFPIADTKVVARLEAPPPQYKMSEVTYLIQKTGDQTPVAFSGAALETLPKDYTGSYQVILKDLDPNTCYQFNVNIETESGVKTDSKVFFEACTFTNVTSDFYGIGEVQNVPGLNGAYSLRVLWPGATNTTDVLPKAGDTYEYRVLVGPKSDISPDQLFDPTNPKVTSYSVSSKYNQTVINGLTSDTEYWIAVRAFHLGYKTQLDNPFYLTEANEFYLEGKTQSDSLSNISWDSSSFEVNLASGSAGLSTAIASWDPVIGLFYNIRLYYVDAALMPNQTDLWTYIMNGNDDACTGNEDGNPNIICKNLSASANLATIAGLTAYSDTHVAMAICLDEACTDANKKIVTVTQSPIRTEPEVAFYSGVVSVIEPSDPYNLDRPQLSVTPPSENGAIDGVVCKMRINAGAEIYLNHPNPQAGVPDTRNTSSVGVLPFDFRTDYYITLTGVDISSSDTYYFKCLPYLVNGATIDIKLDTQLPWVSAAFGLEGPNYTQFPGLDLGFLTCVDSNKSISVTWPTPTAGIYERYLILIKDRSIGNPIFNVQDAYAEDPGYYRFEESRFSNSTTIYGMPPGTYDVAVATFLDYMSGTAYIYSSDNVDVGSCTINP